MALPTELPARLGNSSGPELVVDYLNGNDTTGTGSLANPYKTLDKAVSVVDLGGGIINLRNNGTPHQPQSGERTTIQRTATAPQSNPCTIRTYPADGGRALFKGEIMVGGSGSSYYDGWRLRTFAVTKLTAHRNGVGAYGFRVENARHVEVADLEVYSTNQGNLVTGSVSGLACDNIQVIGNYIHDVGSDDGTGTNIHDHGIYWGGETVAGVNNGAVYNNLIHDCHYGSAVQVFPRASQGVFVYNTMHNTDDAPADATGASVMFFYASGTNGITDCVVHANIMSRSRQDVARNAVEPSAGNGSGNSLKYNLPFDISGTLWPSWAGYVNNATRDADNLTEQDPLFVAVGSDDFHLSAGSPAIQAGDAAFLPPIDLYGTARQHADIGAIAYTADDTQTYMAQVITSRLRW